MLPSPSPKVVGTGRGWGSFLAVQRKSALAQQGALSLAMLKRDGMREASGELATLGELAAVGS